MRPAAEGGISGSLAEPGLPGAPTGPLVLGQDGMLYATVGCIGTAGNGDSVGAVFSSDLLGNAAFLYTNDYEAGDSCDFPPPVALVSAPNGTLYFLNDYCGDGGECSTRLAPPSRSGSSMCSPGPLTLGSDGNFYGTYCSVIFQIKPRGQEPVCKLVVPGSH